MIELGIDIEFIEFSGLLLTCIILQVAHIGPGFKLHFHTIEMLLAHCHLQTAQSTCRFGIHICPGSKQQTHDFRTTEFCRKHQTTPAVIIYGIHIDPCCQKLLHASVMVIIHRDPQTVHP